MFRVNLPAQIAQAATRPVRATRRWLDRHPRRYRDVAPVLDCPACHAGIALTQEMRARLWSHPVLCPQCGDGVISRVPFAGRETDDPTHVCVGTVIGSRPTATRTVWARAQERERPTAYGTGRACTGAWRTFRWSAPQAPAVPGVALEDVSVASEPPDRV
jgi:predicted RNA-binding Zn-ribbon protein involved in translation (DUF1610 family)